jgi:hypothetical protein
MSKEIVLMHPYDLHEMVKKASPTTLIVEQDTDGEPIFGIGGKLRFKQSVAFPARTTRIV